MLHPRREISFGIEGAVSNDPKGGGDGVVNGGERKGRARIRSAFAAGSADRRDRLFALGRRTRQVLLMAGITGALTGLAVAAFDWITQDQLFDHLRRLPAGVQAAAPLAGLL